MKTTSRMYIFTATKNTLLAYPLPSLIGGGGRKEKGGPVKMIAPRRICIEKRVRKWGEKMRAFLRADPPLASYPGSNNAGEWQCIGVLLLVATSFSAVK